MAQWYRIIKTAVEHLDGAGPICRPALYAIAALGGVSSIGTGKTQSRLDSYSGRVNDSFKDKYLLSLVGRVDGSTRFGRSRF